MKVIRKTVMPIKIEAVCAECGDGRMIFNGMVLTTYPPKYSHTCDHCGYVEAFYQQYPRIDYEEVIYGESDNTVHSKSS